MCLPEGLEDTPFNIEPLKDLDGLIDEVLAIDSAKSYLRKQIKLEKQLQEISIRVQP